MMFLFSAGLNLSESKPFGMTVSFDESSLSIFSVMRSLKNFDGVVMERALEQIRFRNGPVNLCNNLKRSSL